MSEDGVVVMQTVVVQSPLAPDFAAVAVVEEEGGLAVVVVVRAAVA